MYYIWVLDSGSTNCTGMIGTSCVEASQVNWITKEMDEVTERGILFFHMPLQEYLEAYNTHDYYGVKNDIVTC